MKLNSTAQARFWAKTDRRGSDDCWPWKGALCPDGYGHIYIFKDGPKMTTVPAHRLSFFLHTGAAPPIVMHRCDNPRCVNPKHLRAGTHADNVADKMAKGRWRGPSRKLTPNQGREAARRLRAGEKWSEVAAHFGCSQGALYRWFSESAGGQASGTAHGAST